MAALDHLVLTCTDLATGVAHIEALTGITAAPGGPHPGIGTHNALLSLGPAVYLEIIAPDPSQDTPTGPRPFGIDDLAVGGSRLSNFAIHPAEETIEQVVATMTAHGFDPGQLSAMSRMKPDGEQLHWNLTHNASAATPLVPFVIDWGTSTHPATVTPTGATLVSLSGAASGVAGSPAGSAGDLRQMHSALELEIGISEGEDEISAVIECPNGRVELR